MPQKMFDFERLTVYQKSKGFNRIIRRFLLSHSDLDKVLSDQLWRASTSVMLNIAEGAGRYTPADKRRFYVNARSSVFECVAALDFFQDEQLISREEYQKIYDEFEEVSKILFAMIKSRS